MDLDLDRGNEEKDEEYVEFTNNPVHYILANSR